MKKIFFLFLIISSLFVGCKSDSTSPEEQSSYLNGSWESNVYSYTGTYYDSLSVKLQLTGKDGKVGGTAVIVHKYKNSKSSAKSTVEQDVVGTYTDNGINISVMGTFYQYVGNLNNDFPGTTRFVGTAKVKPLLSDQEFVYSSLALIKK